MVDERTAYWGDADEARYRTRDDDPTGGNFVVAETLDANGNPVNVLLRWDDTAGEWVSGGAVNMNGSDVTNVGALDANSVSTDGSKIGGIYRYDGITVTEDGSNNRLQFSNISLSPDELLKIVVDIGNIGADGDFKLRFNGDGPTTNYHYEDSDGTKTAGADGIRLFSTTATAPHVKSIITVAEGGGWPGAYHEPINARDKMIDIASHGGREGDSGSINSVEFIFPESPDFSAISYQIAGVLRSV